MNSKKNRASGSRASGELVYLPLGGAGEIGMNLYLYGIGKEHKRQWLMVDCGVKFGDQRDPGIDIILPDTAFIEEERKSLQAIVVTHAHEDHLGAIAWLWPRLRVPVYCTEFAAVILRRKLDEAGLFGDVDIRVVKPGKPFDAGKFNVEFVAVTHSIPEPNAVVLRTKAGTVVHSGDWKLDRNPAIPPDLDESRLREIGREGVDFLVCDSTNVLREGHSPSESDVAQVLTDIILNAENRVAVTTFASHVGRLSTVIRAARQAGREVVVAGRAMRTMIEAAREVGLLKDAGTFLEEEAYGFLPRNKVLLLCTGSQGESRAAMARIANDCHPNITLNGGDMALFSSKTIPGNEKAVSAVMNNLAAQGVEIVTSDDALVHSSGHPRQGELEEFYGWLKPRALVPMHGEMQHLVRHAAFAGSCNIADTLVVPNGSLTRLIPGPVKVIDEVPSGRLHVDGRLIVPSIDGPARFRRKLSFAGIVFVSLTLDGKGNIAAEPQLVTDGLPEFDADGSSIDDDLLDIVDMALDALPKARRRSDEPVIDLIRSAVRRAASDAWGKKPVCHVNIHRV